MPVRDLLLLNMPSHTFSPPSLLLPLICPPRQAGFVGLLGLRPRQFCADVDILNVSISLHRTSLTYPLGLIPSSQPISSRHPPTRCTQAYPYPRFLLLSPNFAFPFACACHTYAAAACTYTAHHTLPAHMYAAPCRAAFHMQHACRSIALMVNFACKTNSKTWQTEKGRHGGEHFCRRAALFRPAFCTFACRLSYAAFAVSFAGGQGRGRQTECRHGGWRFGQERTRRWRRCRHGHGVGVLNWREPTGDGVLLHAAAFCARLPVCSRTFTTRRAFA